MTTAELPETIQASIHQHALLRVPAFFNASTVDILTELFQNARRAGATEIHVITNEGQTTVGDNGNGIADPRTLLAFGESRWDNAVTDSEHPAGMGLYALAHREWTTVSSKTPNGEEWRVTLTPDHFTGKEPAEIQRCATRGRRTGTAVTFQDGGGPSSTGDAAQKAARHHPLDIYLNGKKLRREEFLKDAVYTREWEGVTIGLYRSITYRNREDELNLHGMVVGNAKLAVAGTIGETWSTKVDVFHAPKLELTLPARKEIVENEFTHQLREECLTTIYQAMAESATPVDVTKKMQDDAKSRGVNLPDARAMLSPWRAKRADNIYRIRGRHSNRVPVPSDCIVVDLEAYSPDEVALERAAELAEAQGRRHQLFEADTWMDGYEWYESLPKWKDMTIEVQDGATNWQLEPKRGEGPGIGNQRPDAITIKVTAEEGDGRSSRVTLPTDIAFAEEEVLNIEEATPLVTKESRLTTEELADTIMAAFFCPSDAPEADSAETQFYRAETEAHQLAAETLSTPEDKLRNKLMAKARNAFRLEVPDGTVATIVVSGWHGISVEVKDQ